MRYRVETGSNGVQLLKARKSGGWECVGNYTSEGFEFETGDSTENSTEFRELEKRVEYLENKQDLQPVVESLQDELKVLELNHRMTQATLLSVLHKLGMGGTENTTTAGSGGRAGRVE